MACIEWVPFLSRADETELTVNITNRTGFNLLSHYIVEEQKYANRTYNLQSVGTVCFNHLSRRMAFVAGKSLGSFHTGQLELPLLIRSWNGMALQMTLACRLLRGRMRKKRVPSAYSSTTLCRKARSVSWNHWFPTLVIVLSYRPYHAKIDQHAALFELSGGGGRSWGNIWSCMLSIREQCDGT
jgi:hypothetical protein